jgi:RIO-like serine/threonine protein kinase
MCAVGVPTVIDLQSLLKVQAEDNALVVPRNIDIIVNHFSRVISAAVNKMLNPDLNESEIEKLLM